MKVAPILDGATKESGETILIISLHEGSIIVAALEEFAKAKKKKASVQRLVKQALCEIPVGVPV